LKVRKGRKKKSNNAFLATESHATIFADLEKADPTFMQAPETLHHQHATSCLPSLISDFHHVFYSSISAYLVRPLPCLAINLYWQSSLVGLSPCEQLEVASTLPRQSSKICPTTEKPGHPVQLACITAVFVLDPSGSLQRWIQVILADVVHLQTRQTLWVETLAYSAVNRFRCPDMVSIPLNLATRARAANAE
jgi:hypothetical protein